MICAPSSGWAWISCQPSLSSGPLLPSTRSGTPILPRSCRAAANVRSRSGSPVIPERPPDRRAVGGEPVGVLRRLAVAQRQRPAEAGDDARQRLALCREQPLVREREQGLVGDPQQQRLLGGVRRGGPLDHEQGVVAAALADRHHPRQRPAHERRGILTRQHAQPPRRRAGRPARRPTARACPVAAAGAGVKPCAEARVKPPSCARHADTPSCGTSRATASVSTFSTRSSPCSSDSACPSSTSARPVRAAVRSSPTRAAWAAATSAVSQAQARNAASSVLTGSRREHTTTQRGACWAA